MGKGVAVGAGGAGRAGGDLLLVIAGGGVKTVANEFQNGGKAPRAESWCELQEDEAEGVTKAAGPTCDDDDDDDDAGLCTGFAPGWPPPAPWR